MRIAFHAPLKPPGHPAPSGDRQMARQLIAALELAGHRVEVASHLRTFQPAPDAAHFDRLKQRAANEIDRLSAEWAQAGAPDLWFSYHPYYKAPDLLGLALARRFGLAIVTAEASYAPKRQATPWKAMQDPVGDLVRQAAVNICMTARDSEGLGFLGDAVRVDLPPFIDVAGLAVPPRRGGAGAPVLFTTAMMRPGAKLASYDMLAAALRRLDDLAWHLVVAGDGPERARVAAAFDGFAEGRVSWRGELSRDAVLARLAHSDIYVWPGCGEAYGLAYLEAQAVGLPVVAQDAAGVPAVVRAGETGLLTPEGDVDAYAGAVRTLLLDADLRARMGQAAHAFVHGERSVARAAQGLATILRDGVHHLAALGA